MRRKWPRSVRILQRKGDEKSRLVLVKSPDPRKASVLLIPFESRVQRRDLPNSPKALGEANRRFPVRVFLPPQMDATGPFSHFYLMHNGLGEAQADLYDGLCLDLAARKKTPSVLLPLPLHYCRHHKFRSSKEDPYVPESKDWSIITTQRIFQSVLRSPERLMNSFAQTLSDQEELIRLIDESGEVWSLILEKRARVSLFGYSFGGFSAVAFTFLYPERVETTFLFESGGFIDDIDGGTLFARSDSVARCLWTHYYVRQGIRYLHEPLFSRRENRNRRNFATAIADRPHVGLDPEEDFLLLFNEHPKGLQSKTDGEFDYRRPHHVLRRDKKEGKEVWMDIMERLYEAANERRHHGDLTTNQVKLFKQIYLGHQRVEYKRLLQKFERRILLISGGADNIFPTSELLRLGPETGLALLQVPGITHFVRSRSFEQWLTWVRIIADMMTSFRSYETS